MRVLTSFVILFGACCSAVDALSASRSTIRAHGNRTDSTLVFVAGLEGTGHHFFDQVMRHMNIVPIQLIGNWNWWGMEQKDASWSANFTEDNARFLEEKVSKNPGKVIFIRAVESSSWPNGHGSVQSRRYRRQPSIPLLLDATARASRSMGQDINVQVLVTQRSAVDTLVATCMHRHDLEKCETQAETLEINTRALAEQLKQVDPAAFHCIDYGNLPDIATGLAAALTNVSAPLDTADKMVQTAWQGEGVHHDPMAESTNIVNWAQRMKAPLDEIDAMCQASQRKTQEASEVALPPSRLRRNLGMSPYNWLVVSDILPPAALKVAESRLDSA